MKKVLFAVAALGALIATPAVAQYYQGNRPPPPPAQYDYRGGPGYDQRRAAPPQMRNRRSAHVCVTSRGSCPTQGFMVPGQSCRCVIRGFGSKRGVAR